MSLGMRIRTMTPQRQTRPIRKTVRSRCSRAKSMILSIMDNSPLAGDQGVGKRGVSMDMGSLEDFVIELGLELVVPPGDHPVSFREPAEDFEKAVHLGPRDDLPGKKFGALADEHDLPIPVIEDGGLRHGQGPSLTVEGEAGGGDHAGLQTILFVLDLGPAGDAPRLLLP